MLVKKERLPIVVLAMMCLLSGLWSGLNRIGWNIPLLPIAAHHGIIMVGGFLGTLISLEKIIPLKKRILYGIPFINALGVVLFFIAQPLAAIAMFICASIALTIVFILYFRSHTSLIYVLMLCGSVCWTIGNVLLITRSLYPLAFPWWSAFALFIIAAERLELMRFLPVSKWNKVIFIGLLVSYVVGILLSFHGTGIIVCSVSLAGCALWLLRYDLIGINITRTHLHRFTAIALLTGYIALLMCGVFLFVISDQSFSYDAVVHSFFIGFVFSMIFAHGPMILPGVMGISTTPYHKILYLWLLLLHGSWMMRVFGDVLIELDIRMISGIVSTVAILGYLGTIGLLTANSQRHVPVS